MPPRGKQLRSPKAPVDLDEEAALEVAGVALAHSMGTSRDKAADCISAWITERSRRADAGRLTEVLAFGLGDARLRGMIEACLPQIGEALSGLPDDKPFFDLSKPEIVDLIAITVSILRAAQFVVDERPSLIDDPIPF